MLSRLSNVIFFLGLVLSALIDFNTTMPLCVIVIGIGQACQLCLDFDWIMQV